jgi:transcriptional regulator with XRE-family HTH domain
LDTTQGTPGPEDSGVVDYGQAGPTVVRMLLGARLRRLRQAAGITRDSAGDAIRSSGSKISRLELGRTGFKQRDVSDLLTLYGVGDDAERDVLLGLAQQANTSGWWHAYADVLPAWFEPYLGLEQAASVIRSYEVGFVPGLLQTADYARAVARLPEGVMLDQVDHLIRMSRLAHVTVQVMPFSAGGHAAAGGQVTMLRFAEQLLPDVVYAEQLCSAVYLNKPADTDHYWNVLNKVATEALPPDESVRTLRRLADLI